MEYDKTTKQETKPKKKHNKHIGYRHTHLHTHKSHKIPKPDYFCFIFFIIFCVLFPF